MTAPPFNSDRSALRQNLKAHGLNPNTVFTAVNTPGEHGGLSGSEATIALTTLLNEKESWEYIWAHIAPSPVVLNRFQYRLVWYTVEWSDDEEMWVPETEGHDPFWDHQHPWPEIVPEVSRAAMIDGDTDHVPGIERTITGIDREETPDVLAELVRELQGDERVGVRLWLEPDAVGEHSNLTYDMVAWTGDMFGTSGRWESIDELNETRHPEHSS